MSDLEILIGDCRDAMALLIEAQSVQTVVTSPPYFGLRDYKDAGQLGLEPTPAEFVHALVGVFREVHKVLRPDGTVWLNLGDSYARTGGTDKKAPPTATVGSTRQTLEARGDRKQRAPEGLKEKDLIGIPWRVALALQADGWYLRQDIIWHKPNAMPESVTDRCVKAHEYVFLLSKSAKYLFNHEAIREPAAYPEGAGNRKAYKVVGERPGDNANKGGSVHKIGARDTRNKRSVWGVTTKPFKEGHFATFPPQLVEPCVLAGSNPGDLVLDPFGGSGTTAGVALKHGRRAVVCELNPEYAALMPERIARIKGAA